MLKLKAKLFTGIKGMRDLQRSLSKQPNAMEALVEKICVAVHLGVSRPDFF